MFNFVKKVEQMYGGSLSVHRGDKDSKKLIKWVPKCVQFYYGSATGNTCLLFKISSEHIPKNVVQTWVLEQ